SLLFFFSSRRRHTRFSRDWSSDVCSSDLLLSRNFAAKGAKVAIHYNSDNTKAEGEKTLADIINAGGEAFLFQADLTDVKKHYKRSEERRVGKECRSRWSRSS